MDQTCFVIIGYGKKTSYANGKPRSLDLDQTYKILIQPVFKKLGIACYRAIDKNNSGSIDQLMLQEIRDADIALVDISTLNANVMWELGVRHALKPKHTIMICEKEQMASVPFDVNHFVVHSYTHSEEGIPHTEVTRFKKYLRQLVLKVLAEQNLSSDSPVYTFLGNIEIKNNLTEKKDGTNENPLSSDVAGEIPNTTEDSNVDSFSLILDLAEKAKNNKDYKTAIQLFEKAKKEASQNAFLKDGLTFIVGRIALCMYKSDHPNTLSSLRNAWKILQEAKPDQSMDIEILGLAGAIQKRLFDATQDLKFLQNSINYYQKGFFSKQDYYNGINLAFMLYLQSHLIKKEGGEWREIKLKADFFRDSVLGICLRIENQKGFEKSTEGVWVLLTISECYIYQNNELLANEYLEKAKKHNSAINNSFAFDSFTEQKRKIDLFIFDLE